MSQSHYTVLSLPRVISIFKRWMKWDTKYIPTFSFSSPNQLITQGNNLSQSGLSPVKCHLPKKGPYLWKKYTSLRIPSDIASNQSFSWDPCLLGKNFKSKTWPYQSLWLKSGPEAQHKASQQWFTANNHWTQQLTHPPTRKKIASRQFLETTQQDEVEGMRFNIKVIANKRTTTLRLGEMSLAICHFLPWLCCFHKPAWASCARWEKKMQSVHFRPKASASPFLNGK